MEQREELMVSPTGGIPTSRKAHFLKPSVSAIEGPSMKLPFLKPKPAWPLEVIFNGWTNPIRKWAKWVHKMEQTHSSIWKNVGIYEAIISSTYKILRDKDLIFGLAERWCSETNTFIFPWGESTITLEDLLILGGFPVLGTSPVSLPRDSQELVNVEIFLAKLKTNSNHPKWLKMFMNGDTEFEHEAFLSLWLSKFVFPGNDEDMIGEHVFRVAIHLARGTRIALAPAVLASIYRDLSLLRGSMAASTKIDDPYSFLALTLWSPLCYVQVWAWERLPPLHPLPKFLNSGEPRLARWKRIKSDIGNVRPAIEYAGETFLWRPYTLALDNWSIPKFYKEKEEWVLGKDLDCPLESFARCLKVCKLVGMDCEEPYYPHRVAMQFGLDQDLTGWVSPDEVVSYDFVKPLADDEMLYLPSRLYEADVTTRYLQWWIKTVLCLVNPFQGVKKRKRSSRLGHNRPFTSTRLMKMVKLEEDTIEHSMGHCLNVPPPPGFPPKSIDVKRKSVESFKETQPLIKQEDDNSIQSFESRISVMKDSVQRLEAWDEVLNARRSVLKDNIQTLEARLARSNNGVESFKQTQPLIKQEGDSIQKA